MGKVVEVTVTKGKTVKAEDREEWLRIEYSVKAAVEDSAEVQVAKAEIEGLIDGWLTGVSKPTVSAAPSNVFPKELSDLLTFEDKGEWTIIKPKAFLGSENFAKIAALVRQHGGDYVSAGKESHFRIPRKTAK